MGQVLESILPPQQVVTQMLRESNVLFRKVGSVNSHYGSLDFLSDIRRDENCSDINQIPNHTVFVTVLKRGFRLSGIWYRWEESASSVVFLATMCMVLY